MTRLGHTLAHFGPEGIVVHLCAANAYDTVTLWQPVLSEQVVQSGQKFAIGKIPRSTENDNDTGLRSPLHFAEILSAHIFILSDSEHLLRAHVLLSHQTFISWAAKLCRHFCPLVSVFRSSHDTMNAAINPFCMRTQDRPSQKIFP
jgi:hypothetical protein